MIAGREGHITLVFDLDSKAVNCAALMPGKFELFETAEFEEMHEDGQNALYVDM